MEFNEQDQLVVTYRGKTDKLAVLCASQPEVTVGRVPGCTIVINKSSVSRTHFVIRRPGTVRIQVEDRSSFGTYIGDNRQPLGKAKCTFVNAGESIGNMAGCPDQHDAFALTVQVINTHNNKQAASDTSARDLFDESMADVSAFSERSSPRKSRVSHPHVDNHKDNSRQDASPMRDRNATVTQQSSLVQATNSAGRPPATSQSSSLFSQSSRANSAASSRPSSKLLVGRTLKANVKRQCPTPLVESFKRPKLLELDEDDDVVPETQQSLSSQRGATARGTKRNSTEQKVPTPSTQTTLQQPRKSPRKSKQTSLFDTMVPQPRSQTTIPPVATRLDSVKMDEDDSEPPPAKRQPAGASQTANTTTRASTSKTNQKQTRTTTTTGRVVNPFTQFDSVKRQPRPKVKQPEPDSMPPINDQFLALGFHEKTLDETHWLSGNVSRASFVTPDKIEPIPLKHSNYGDLILPDPDKITTYQLNYIHNCSKLVSLVKREAKKSPDSSCESSSTSIHQKKINVKKFTKAAQGLHRFGDGRLPAVVDNLVDYRKITQRH